MLGPADEAGRAAKNAAALAAVWERFRDGTLAKVAAIEEATIALLEGRLSPEQRQLAEREAHKLAGSCGTFGFPYSSQLAREIETRLGSEAPPASDAVLISEKLMAMRQDLAGQPQPVFSAGGSVDREASQTLLLLAVDPVLTDRITAEAEARGIRCVVADSVEMANALVPTERVTAVLLRLDGAAADEDLLDFIKHYQSAKPPIPTVVLTTAPDFVFRLEIARHGAVRLLEGLLTPREIIDTLMGVLHPGHAVSAKALLIDHDPAVFRALESLLEPRGVEVVALDDPRRFWSVLHAVRPDLLIIEPDLPHIDGADLCRVVRNAREWCELPIIFLATRTDAASVEAAFTAGCDDYVAKALMGAALLPRLENRLDRIRLHRSRAGKDAVTGLYDRARSMDLIGRMLRLAQRKADPYCLAIVEVSGFDALNERHEYEAVGNVMRALARLLTQSFRAEDVIGRWTPGAADFTIGMYASNKAQAAAKISQLVDGWSHNQFSMSEDERSRLTLMAGVAEYPGDGETVEMLRQSASSALAQAKVDGGSAVRQAGEQLPGSTSLVVDVAIVDDDEALVGLLRHSLESRRLTVATFPDGESAVEAMTGETPRVRAAVILLDVDLPALNGLQALRRLSKSGLTRTSRVLMLTARSGEEDVLTALDLGAIDHISKPFSVPVLVRKVEAALRQRQ